MKINSIIYSLLSVKENREKVSVTVVSHDIYNFIYSNHKTYNIYNPDIFHTEQYAEISGIVYRIILDTDIKIPYTDVKK